MTIHGIGKTTIPTVNILGVNIAAIDMNWLLAFTKSHVKELSGNYICVSNVHTTVMSYEDEAYKAVQNGGILAIPDGKPLSIEGQRRGAKNMNRTAGPDYMREVLKLSAEYGWKHYFLGSTQDTLNKLKVNLERDYPKLQIVGMFSPPFRTVTEEEDQAIIKEINSSEPDFLWVGLGAPKQEKWLAAHQGKVRGLMVGVGAAFDFYAGNIKRAPDWFQKSSLEWLYRLAQEPKRLWKRYFVTNSKFIWHAMIKGR